MMSLFSFSDNWMELSRRYPKEFIEEVERRYLLDGDWEIYIRITKEGHRADKTFERKGSQIRPGEWIVRPYSPMRIQNILMVIEKGRLKVKGSVT